MLTGFSLFDLGWRRSGNIRCTSQEQQLSPKSSNLWWTPRSNNQCRQRKSVCYQKRFEEGLSFSSLGLVWVGCAVFGRRVVVFFFSSFSFCDNFVVVHKLFFTIVRVTSFVAPPSPPHPSLLQKLDKSAILFFVLFSFFLCVTKNSDSSARVYFTSFSFFFFWHSSLMIFFFSFNIYYKKNLTSISQ